MKNINEFLNNLLDFSEYITESGYSIIYDTKEDYLKAFEDKYGKLSSADNAFINLILDIWVENNQDKKIAPFRFSDDKNEVKVFTAPYMNSPKVEAFFDGTTYNPVNGKNEIISNWQKNGVNFKINDNKNIKFIWGKGSVQNEKSPAISTDIQEHITAMIFNMYYSIQNKLTLEDMLLQDWGEYDKYKDNIYKDWHITWLEQCKSAFNVVKGWPNAYMVRYGDDDPVCDALVLLHKALTKLAGVPQKDAIDPTDNIIYDKSKANEIAKSIVEIVNSIGKITGANETLFNELIIKGQALIKELYNNKEYIGISLKKGAEFEARYLNFDEPEDFKCAEIASITFNPVQQFFGKSTSLEEIKKLLDEAPKDERDLVKYYKKNIDSLSKRSKGATVMVDTLEEKGITVNVRTKGGEYCTILPTLPGAQMGDCPVEKFRKAFSKYVDMQNVLNNVKHKKLNEKDIDDICEKWDELKAEYHLVSDTNILKKMLLTFAPILNKIEPSYILTPYQVLYMLYAMMKGGPELIRKILLWCEKIDSDCLPYVLLKPTK